MRCQGLRAAVVACLSPGSGGCLGGRAGGRPQPCPPACPPCRPPAPPRPAPQSWCSARGCRPWATPPSCWSRQTCLLPAAAPPVVGLGRPPAAPAAAAPAAQPLALAAAPWPARATAGGTRRWTTASCAWSSTRTRVRGAPPRLLLLALVDSPWRCCEPPAAAAGSCPFPPPPAPAPLPGLLHSMRGPGGAQARLSAAFGWYNSSDGLEAGHGPDDNRGQASGAYIFRWAGNRPRGTAQQPQAGRAAAACWRISAPLPPPTLCNACAGPTASTSCPAATRPAAVLPGGAAPCTACGPARALAAPLPARAAGTARGRRWSWSCGGARRCQRRGRRSRAGPR